jgi:hypothetical protein
MATWTQEAVDALAAAVGERRRYLGRSQIEVWQHGGPANSTMTSLETAASLSVTPSTLKKLDIGLEWVPGTAARVVRGEVPPSSAVSDARFDARGASDDGRAADHSISLGDFAALVAALSVDADDIRLTTRALDTSVDTEDPQSVDSFVSAVEDVIGDVDDFVDVFDDLARKVFGGDTERLRSMKRETKRFRRQQSATRALNVTSKGAVDTAPSGAALRAARTAPPGYTTGQSGQGHADGEATQDE